MTTPSKVRVPWVGDETDCKLYYADDGAHGPDTAAHVQLADEEVGVWAWTVYRPAWPGRGKPPADYVARLDGGIAYTPRAARHAVVERLGKEGCTFVFEPGPPGPAIGDPGSAALRVMSDPRFGEGWSE